MALAPPSSEPGTDNQNIIVRDAREADVRTIQTIYAHQVLHGIATFEEVSPTADELPDDENHSEDGA